MGLGNDKILCKQFVDDLMDLINYKIEQREKKLKKGNYSDFVVDVEQIFRNKYQKKGVKK